MTCGSTSPGNSPGRINSSLQFGGPDLLISTIKANFDIDINHYVQVNFAGFKSLVDQIGGVPVYFATPVRDQGGLNVTDGRVHHPRRQRCAGLRPQPGT